MNTNQHLFKAWEAWVIRPDGRYYRYLGFENSAHRWLLRVRASTA